jgi:UDP-3-O-[3-hydroxymyristoyl] glucosamine N-acyltransferase
VRASEIADLVAGVVEGGDDPDLVGIAPLDRAGPADLSFLAHPRYLRYVDATRAGALLVTTALADRATGVRVRIKVPDVHRALALLVPRLHPEPRRAAGLHPTVVVGAGSVLGEGVTVGAYTVLGDGVVLGDRVRIGPGCVLGDGCVLGEDVVLHPQVTLYAGSRIGARSILHSGVRVGVDGFGYAFVDGAHRKIPQVGGCLIGADVEIGANTTIDRGSIGSTEIGDGVKIDNLVHIAHNVRIGAHSVIVAQVGIAGSTTVGRGVTLAGQVGVTGHVTIGDGATLAAQAGVFGDVPPGGLWSGYPARPHREALRAQAALARLPKLIQRVRRLEARADGDGEGTEE